MGGRANGSTIPAGGERRAGPPPSQPPSNIPVPAEDFNFEEQNARFNKREVVKVRDADIDHSSTLQLFSFAVGCIKLC